MDNRISSSLAILAGVMLTIAKSPISQAQNEWAELFTTLNSNGQPFFGALALIMSILVQLGGLTICIGGILCFKGHLRSGKELIGIGTGVGLADLLLLAHSGTFGPPEWLGWGGLLMAVLAGRHVHGPESSYAGEIRRLLSALRTRFNRRRKQVQNKRVRRRARRAKQLTGQHNFSRDKESESQGASKYD